MPKERKIPKYVMERFEKNLPLNKRQWEWLQRNGIIRKDASWSTWKRMASEETKRKRRSK